MSKKVVQTLVTPTLLYLNGITQTRLPLLHISEISLAWSRRQILNSVGLRSFLRGSLPVLRYHNPHVKFNVSIQGILRKPDPLDPAVAASPSASASPAPASGSSSSSVSSSSSSDSLRMIPLRDGSRTLISLRSSSSPASSPATVVDVHSLNDLEILHQIFAFDGQRLDDASFSLSQLKTPQEKEDYKKKIEEMTANRLKEMQKLQEIGKESRKRAGIKVVRYQGPAKEVRKKILAIRKAYRIRKAKRLADTAAGTPKPTGTTTTTATSTDTAETLKKEKGKEEKK